MIVINLVALLIITSFGKGSSQDEEGSARFIVSGKNLEYKAEFNSVDNLVFAELYSDDSMWIRLAADQSKLGEDSPHLDIDLCNYSGSGIYDPIDPQKRPCSESGWDLWWHGEKVFLNQKNSNPCTLELKQSGDTLTGIFACSDLIEFKGTQLVQVSEGSFKTLITRK